MSGSDPGGGAPAPGAHGGSSLTERVTLVATRLARRGPPARAVYRVGLGAVILLAGLHKLVAPAEWAQYLAPVFASAWPFAVDASMVVAGLTELPFGLALVLDRYARLSAVVVTLSLLGTSVGLAVLVLETGRGGDVLVRDLGLFVFALGVSIDLLGES